MTQPVKYRLVQRTLLANGWECKRTKGSHEFWTGPGGYVTIPHHRDVCATIIIILRVQLVDVPDEWWGPGYGGVGKRWAGKN
jgi:predicted RNA binding protein YcfA (HicA-like mRNA interferase family)